MKSLLLFLTILCGSLVSAAEPQTLFFARESAKEYTHIVLTLDGDQVTGSKVWQPRGTDGAHGSLQGILTGGGIIQVLFEFTIEGDQQSAEEVYKLNGNTLLVGEGEMVDGGNGRMNLKDANKVGFTTSLKKVDVSEPKPGTPVRKAIMDAMRVPVSAHAGKAVTFTGNIRVSGSWARFQGNVATSDGRPPKDPDVAADLELDFFGLLFKDPGGTWKVMHWGFAGDISVGEEAREKFPAAPWVLFE